MQTLLSLGLSLKLLSKVHICNVRFMYLYTRLYICGQNCNTEMNNNRIATCYANDNEKCTVFSTFMYDVLLFIRYG